MSEFNKHVHSNGLFTEISAYEKTSKRSESTKSKILSELQDAGVHGLTPDEFLLLHGGLINTIRRRFTDLWKEGKIQHHPALLTRKNIDGNDCITWVLGRDMDLENKKPKSKWVGLDWNEMPEIYMNDKAFEHGAQWAEAKLKEKNT
jgi:hypothetical protein